jgi:hypothetical protein
MYVINYWKHKGDASPENYPNSPVFNRTGRGLYAYTVWTLLMMDRVANCIFKFLSHLHKNMGIPETHETGTFKIANQQVITANLMIWLFISFSSMSYDRSKASSKASFPHSVIQSFLCQMRVSTPFLNLLAPEFYI